LQQEVRTCSGHMKQLSYVHPTIMTKAQCLVFLVIGVLLMSLVVDAQPAVDDGESCQPTTLKEAVNSIRANIQLTSSCQSLDETARDVKLMKEDLTEVKNMTSHERRRNGAEEHYKRHDNEQRRLDRTQE